MSSTSSKCLLSAIIIKIFDVRSFSHDLNYPATLLLFLCYCMTINTMIYVAEKRFSEPSYGQVLVFSGCIITGCFTLVIMLLFFMLYWIQHIADARKLLSIVFLVLPPYALGKLMMYNTYI